MKAISAEPIGRKSNGTEIVRAMVVSDTVPNPLPTNGKNVDGMLENQIFAPFSMLYVVGGTDTKIFIANESGTFVPQ